jgi:hypothetical protein
MNVADTLLAIAHIKALKARYFRLLDTKQWAAWRDVFAPDLVAEFPDDPGNEQPFRDRETFLAAISTLLQPALTIHHGHTAEIEVPTPTTARGIWVMQDWVQWPQPGHLPNGARQLVGWGHYHETYVKSAAGWQIATLKLTRLKVDYS